MPIGKGRQFKYRWYNAPRLRSSMCDTELDWHERGFCYSIHSMIEFPLLQYVVAYICQFRLNIITITDESNIMPAFVHLQSISANFTH